MALHSHVWKLLSSGREWPFHFESLLSPRVLLCFVGHLRVLLATIATSWLPLLAVPSITTIFLGNGNSVMFPLIGVSLLTCTTVLEHEFYLLPASWGSVLSCGFSCGPKIEKRSSGVMKQSTSRMVASEWDTYAFMCHSLYFLSPTADRILFEV